MGWSLGFFFFFSSFLCGMKAWFLEQLCNHKGKAYGCWLGGVLAWLHCCSWFCESFQASCSMPDTHPAHIPSSRASDFKNFHCFFYEKPMSSMEEVPSAQLWWGNTHFLLQVSVARHWQGGRCCSCVFIAVILFWSAHLLKSTFSTEQDFHW